MISEEILRLRVWDAFPCENRPYAVVVFVKLKESSHETDSSNRDQIGGDLSKPAGRHIPEKDGRPSFCARNFEAVQTKAE